MTDNIQNIASRLRRKSVRPGITIGAYYHARCPFCGVLNEEWQYSINNNKSFNANSKCKHFIGITEKTFSFERRPESLVTDSNIFLGGVKFPQHIRQYVYDDNDGDDEDHLLNGLPSILFCCQSNGHEWPGERLLALLRVLTKEKTLNEEFPKE